MEKQSRPLSPVVVDTLLALGMLFIGLVGREEAPATGAIVYSREADVWNTIIIVFQTLPLMFRRRFPRSTLAVVVAAFAVDRVLDYPNTFASAGVVMAVHAIGSELEPRTSLRIGVPLVVAVSTFTLVGALTFESVGFEQVGFMVLVVAIPLVLGREVNLRRRRLQELEQRAERAEREREERAKEAVAEERARIARELHDVVAHQMAVMTIQAEGASRLARDADPRIVESLGVIKDSGRQALAEMRRMVGLLRAPDDAGDGLAPQPGVDQIDPLITSMREAGLKITFDVEGQPHRLPPGADVSVFRIVQESLTNALKHGGPDTSADVRIAYTADDVTIDVIDDGRGAAAAINRSGSGHGLVGMRERVAVLDGEFRAGPHPGGGFAVHASFPVDA